MSGWFECACSHIMSEEEIAKTSGVCSVCGLKNTFTEVEKPREEEE